MEIRRLGSTNLPVTPIGLGLAALGRPGYINLGHADDLHENYAVESMEEHAHQVLEAAWRAGIRYFDAARSYGRAEEFLGSWLESRDIEPQNVTVGSKWGYTYTAGWKVEAEKHEVKEHSLAVLQRQWLESQENLAGYLKLYQIHSATLESGVLENQPVLAELAHLKSEGIFIGLTLSGANQAEILNQALGIVSYGQRLFDTVQVTWNLLERSTTSVLQSAHKMGMGVIVKEALANGRLTDRNQDPDFIERAKILKYQAKRLGTTIDALALAVVMAQPWVDIVLSGAAAEEHIHSNVKALDVSLDQEALEQISELVELPEEYWAKRSTLDWN
jgi:aryl-alcohol dehydrogenase-like predicted oxidoreductase